MSRAKELLEQAVAHDDALFYCDKCGNRYYPDSIGDVHDRTSEECRPGGCLAPEDHHPFVEGSLPSYEEAAVDRRNLLRVVLPEYQLALDALRAVARGWEPGPGPFTVDMEAVNLAINTLARLGDEVTADV